MKNKIIKKLLLLMMFGSLTGTMLFLFTQNNLISKKIYRGPIKDGKYVSYNIEKVEDAKQAYTAPTIMKQVAKEFLFIKNKQPTPTLINPTDTPILNHFQFKIKKVVTNWQSSIWYSSSSTFSSISFELNFNDDNAFVGSNSLNTIRFTNLKTPNGLIPMPTRKDVVWNLTLQGGDATINSNDGYFDPYSWNGESAYNYFARDIVFPDYQEARRKPNRLWTKATNFKVNKEKTIVEYDWCGESWEYQWTAASKDPSYLKDLNINFFQIEPIETIAHITVVFDPKDMPPPPTEPDPPIDPDNSQPSDKPTDNNGNTGDTNNNPTPTPDPNAPDTNPPSGNPDSNPNDNAPAPDDGQNKPDTNPPPSPDYNPDGTPPPNNGDDNGLGPDGGAPSPEQPDNKPDNNEPTPPNQDNSTTNPDNKPIVPPPSGDDVPNDNKPDPNSPSDPQDGNKPDPNAPNDNPNDTTKPESGNDPTIDDSQSPSDENLLSTSNQMSMGFVMTLVSACVMAIMILLLTSVMLSPFGKK